MVKEKPTVKFCLKKPCNKFWDTKDVHAEFEQGCKYICPRPCKCLLTSQHPCLCCQCGATLPPKFMLALLHSPPPSISLVKHPLLQPKELGKLPRGNPRKKVNKPCSSMSTCTCPPNHPIPCVCLPQLSCRHPVAASSSLIPSVQPTRYPHPYCVCTKPGNNCQCLSGPSRHAQASRVSPTTIISATPKRPVACGCSPSCVCPSNHPNCHCPIPPRQSAGCVCLPSCLCPPNIQNCHCPISPKLPVGCVCSPSVCPPNQQNCPCSAPLHCQCSSHVLQVSPMIPAASTSTSVNCGCHPSLTPCVCPPTQPNVPCPVPPQCECSTQEASTLSMSLSTQILSTKISYAVISILSSIRPPIEIIRTTRSVPVSTLIITMTDTFPSRSVMPVISSPPQPPVSSTTASPSIPPLLTLSKLVSPSKIVTSKIIPLSPYSFGLHSKPSSLLLPSSMVVPSYSSKLQRTKVVSLSPSYSYKPRPILSRIISYPFTPLPIPSKITPSLSLFRSLKVVPSFSSKLQSVVQSKIKPYPSLPSSKIIPQYSYQPLRTLSNIMLSSSLSPSPKIEPSYLSKLLPTSSKVPQSSSTSATIALPKLNQTYETLSSRTLPSRHQPSTQDVFSATPVIPRTSYKPKIIAPFTIAASIFKPGDKPSLPVVPPMHTPSTTSVLQHVTSPPPPRPKYKYKKQTWKVLHPEALNGKHFLLLIRSPVNIIYKNVKIRLARNRIPKAHVLNQGKRT